MGTFVVGLNAFCIVLWLQHKSLEGQGVECGGLNRYCPHRPTCLNVWSIESGTIRRYDLVEENVSLRGRL